MMHADSTSAAVNLRSLLVDDSNRVPDIAVTDITSDSRKAREGGLFLACSGGTQHGLEYVADALAAKVAAVVWEPAADHQAPELPAGVVGLEVPELSAQVGAIADRFFAQPSGQLAVTGVTGTNGKTTVARVASTALSLLDGTTAYMGTMGFGVGDDLVPSALTTPGCIVVHRRLRQFADAGAENVVMEVSSHGLDQGRVDGVRITTAALTNLSRDHLDYHGDLKSYGEAKARLFARPELQTAIVNVSDSFGAQLAARDLSAETVIRVAIVDASTPAVEADLNAELLSADANGLHIRFSGRFGTSEFTSPMWGRFNAENLAIAAGILLAHDFSLQQVTAALAHINTPAGRMEVLRSDAGQPTVVVDFAHTPAALEQALLALRDHCDGAIWCVFGCGGNRDQGKRGEMGAVAESHADHVVLTDDNPRHEDPAAIIETILAGVATPDAVQVIRDRASAIATAIDQAAARDAVLIAGKGSEAYQLVADQRLEFSDAAVAKAALGGAG